MNTVAFPHKQSGAALLAFILILIAGSSYMLVYKLNNYSSIARDTNTHAALNEAKKALLSYAMNYPELRSSTEKGPGFLPCPDQNNDGNPTNCGTSVTATMRLGRLPFRILGLADIQDSGGDRLWYAVSDNFKNTLSNNTIINSETPGLITVDGMDDIVAVIIAPGEPVNSQTLRPSNNAADYLEDVNPWPDTGSFVTTSAGEFNDQLITITRQELMAAVEKRVVGDVVSTLNTYREDPDKNDINGIDQNCIDNGESFDCDNTYPWLSPYSNPATSTFKSFVATRNGHLPYHWSGDIPGESNRNPFQTPISWAWRTDVGTATGSFWGTVTADCLRNIDCDDGLFPPIPSVDVSSINCIWTDKDTANCEPSDWITMSSFDCIIGCAGICTRQYRVQFPEYIGNSIISKPAINTTRSRSVVRNGTLPTQNSAVRIRDRIQCGASITTLGEGNINFTGSTTGMIATSRIQYDIDIDDGELPEWFVRNNWHEQIYISYSSGLDPDSTTNCTPGIDCINVSIQRPYGPESNEDIEALIVMAAGMPLSQSVNTMECGNIIQDRTQARMCDYFENINAVDNFSFEQVHSTSSFNDQIRIIIP